jgi:hypothetical protein
MFSKRIEMIEEDIRSSKNGKALMKKQVIYHSHLHVHRKADQHPSGREKIKLIELRSKTTGKHGGSAGRGGQSSGNRSPRQSRKNGPCEKGKTEEIEIEKESLLLGRAVEEDDDDNTPSHPGSAMLK